MLLLWRNSGAGANTVTLTSIADSHGRSGDVTTFSVGAGEYGARGGPKTQPKRGRCGGKRGRQQNGTIGAGTEVVAQGHGNTP